MTFDALKKMTGEELNAWIASLEESVEKVRAQYRIAADRECANQLQEISKANFEWRRRVGIRV